MIGIYYSGNRGIKHLSRIKKGRQATEKSGELLLTRKQELTTQVCIDLRNLILTLVLAIYCLLV